MFLISKTTNYVNRGNIIIENSDDTTAMDTDNSVDVSILRQSMVAYSDHL